MLKTGMKRMGSIDEFDLVGAVGLLDRMHRLAGIGHRIDHVPDQFPLHLAVGLRHFDPHHPHGLELEIQRPDVVAKVTSLAQSKLLSTASNSTMSCRLNDSSCLRSE